VIPVSQNGNNPDVRVDIDIRVNIDWTHRGDRNIDITAPLSIVSNIDPTKAIATAVKEAITEAAEKFHATPVEAEDD
jgi:subtilisin-like proprotein convertase family protein